MSHQVFLALPELLLGAKVVSLCVSHLTLASGSLRGPQIQSQEENTLEDLAGEKDRGGADNSREAAALPAGSGLSSPLCLSSAVLITAERAQVMALCLFLSQEVAGPSFPRCFPAGNRGLTTQL